MTVTITPAVADGPLLIFLIFSVGLPFLKSINIVILLLIIFPFA